jgi:hypothetical protein
MKCKYCSFSTTDRKAMATHLRNNHASYVPSNSGSYTGDSFIDDLIVFEAASNFFGGSSSDDDSSSSFSSFSSDDDD